MELRSISRLLDHVNIQLCQRLEQHARSLGYRTEAEESWFHNALGDYYRARLTGGEILSPRDRRLIMYLCAIAPEDYPILEFCAGAGQLSAALLSPRIRQRHSLRNQSPSRVAVEHHQAPH